MEKNDEKIEMFRISPELNKYYEYAEYTIKDGKFPNTRYFINSPPRYVGLFIKREEGGCGDGSWRIDYFQDNTKIIPIKYSYEGTTCFREVLSYQNKIYYESPLFCSCS